MNGKTLFRHIVSNGQEALAVLRPHNHVLAIGAHRHVGERVTLFNEGVRTVFAQSPAVVGRAASVIRNFRIADVSLESREIYVVGRRPVAGILAA